MSVSRTATERRTCPACGEGSVRTGPPSRSTGAVVAACSRCGCHWLSNPESVEDIAESYDFDREMYEAYVQAKRHTTLDLAYEATLDVLERTVKSGGRALFDVGAGAGEFLELARARGFDPHGNELAPGAIQLARELTGIELHFGDLVTVEGSNRFDAMTMWCVLAHVGEPADLLSHVRRLLKPGGVLFLQTPRWSAMDTAGLVTARASGGRVTRVLDRRVNDAHMMLNSRRGLTMQATRAGFDVIDVRALARYSLNTESYLGSLGVPVRARRALARGLDLAVDRNLFFRNVLDLYARKPLTSDRSAG